MLQGEVPGCAWLDLCAGNGVMGAEALCRGAAIVVGIEASGLVCRTMRDNWQRVGQPQQTYRVMRGDVLTCLPRLAGEQFPEPAPWERCPFGFRGICSKNLSKNSPNGPS
jgi:16S rRNA (guanine966-N2)-methyltransferase